MANRITEQDRRFRHSPLVAMCVALGFINAEEAEADPVTTLWRFYERVDQAIQRGDIVKPEDGHYHLTEQAYQRSYEIFKTRSAA